MAADLTIVRDMHICHDPVVITQARNPDVLRRTRVNGYELANGIAIADFKRCLLAGVFFVLRVAANRAKPIEHIVFTDGGMAIDDAVLTDNATFSDRDICMDDRIGAYLHRGMQLGAIMNNRGRVDKFGHCSSRSRIAHMIAASATTAPSTVARALYLQMTLLIRSAVTSS